MYLLQAAEVFSTNTTEIDPVLVKKLIEELSMATDTSSTGGSTNFAEDLKTTNSLLDATINFLTVDAATTSTFQDLNEVTCK